MNQVSVGGQPPRRTPLMPVEYEAALQALQACIEIDEARYWSDKAEALAAWAKIYRSREAEIKARKLKLHAYRRMGQIAVELRPASPRDRAADGKTMKGGRSALLESGLRVSTAQQALVLARLPAPDFEVLVNQPRPPAPSTFVAFSAGMWAKASPHVYNLLSATRRHDPVGLASAVDTKDAARVRAAARELIEWLDRFEQHLPREGR